MQVHAKDKPIPREGNAVWESDALLHRTAELTIGMAGADLANLLNEASILMACPQHTFSDFVHHSLASLWNLALLMRLMHSNCKPTAASELCFKCLAFTADIIARRLQELAC